MCKYGYCRISTPKQNIERQERNIKAAYPEAVILKEVYTGTRLDRPEWEKLFRKVKSGDTIIFDSVSRMSRNAADGWQTYQELYDRGVELIFLKEPHINTQTYKSALDSRIKLTGDDVDEILIGVNRYLMRLAEKQIILAFEQAQKEVDDLRQRTKEGIETARLEGKQIGRKGEAGSLKHKQYLIGTDENGENIFEMRELPAETKTAKKQEAVKKYIRKNAKCFGGSMTDALIIDHVKANAADYHLAKFSKATYYRYKNDLIADVNAEIEGENHD